MISLGKKNRYSLIRRGFCIKPFDSTKYAEALSEAVRPHKELQMTSHVCGRLSKNTYGPLLFAPKVLLIQSQHPYDISRKAYICLLSRCELHVLPQHKVVDSRFQIKIRGGELCGNPALARGRGVCEVFEDKVNRLDSPLSVQCFGTPPIRSFQALWDDTFQFPF